MVQKLKITNPRITIRGKRLAKDKTPKDGVPERGLTSSLHQIKNKESEDSESPKSMKYHKVDINWDKVETAMAMGGDLKVCAAFGGCHWNTLERRILERYGEGFKDVRQSFLTDRKMVALKALWMQVHKGNWNAIKFANQAFNGLNDRPKDMGDEDETDDGSTFKLAYDPHEPPPINAEYKPIEE